MKFIYRLAYFSVGLFLGIGILFFILSGKKTSCAYGPESRTLKNIRLKPRAFSEEAMDFFNKKNIDTASVSELLVNGDVLFSESNIKPEDCKEYVVEGEYSDNNLKIYIENCEEKATILKAKLLPK
ncbi:DUF4258 domain-containing protein [Aequorivita echinoideorum]|uniref:DUF4258 domain-containing protein n=1 Tax=Aequorivita echinoideorum TaxID=1549647 RepID=A0ABS5S6B0_9FLAO|nr:DUF4258 domain-containing protein [Aequorivita echinoideorum]MBT0608753.1 DUF4258 domain-containing protein [Aequorivita echinoideorum]